MEIPILGMLRPIQMSSSLRVKFTYYVQYVTYQSSRLYTPLSHLTWKKCQLRRIERCIMCTCFPSRSILCKSPENSDLLRFAAFVFSPQQNAHTQKTDLFGVPCSLAYLRLLWRGRRSPPSCCLCQLFSKTFSTRPNLQRWPSHLKQKKTCTKKRQNCATQKDIKNIKESKNKPWEMLKPQKKFVFFQWVLVTWHAVLPSYPRHNTTKDCSIPCFILHLLRDFYTTLHILHYDYYIAFSSNCSTCCLQSLQFIHCNRVNRSSGFAHV